MNKNEIEVYETYERVINENPDEGCVYGFLSNSDEIFINFLENNDYYEEDFTSLDEYKNCTKAYISNMYIEEEYRGNGNGSILLGEALGELFDYSDAKYAFLVCDNIQHNEFSLQKWYESYGFKVIADKFDCPLMVLEKEE